MLAWLWFWIYTVGMIWLVVPRTGCMTMNWFLMHSGFKNSWLSLYKWSFVRICTWAANMNERVNRLVRSNIFIFSLISLSTYRWNKFLSFRFTSHIRQLTHPDRSIAKHRMKHSITDPYIIIYLTNDGKMKSSNLTMHNSFINHSLFDGWRWALNMGMSVFVHCIAARLLFPLMGWQSTFMEYETKPHNRFLWFPRNSEGFSLASIVLALKV